MYDFHYNFIQKNFNAELLSTDTDSLTYEIKSENVYEEFFKWKHLFDFSNYSEDSEFSDDTNKEVIGKMRDEFGGGRGGGVIATEFIKLKPKMYSIKKINDRELNTAKGVNIATDFNEFKHQMKRIQSKKHKIGTYEINKISLSCFDDKRYVLDDGIHTLAYFHKGCNNRKKIVMIKKDCDN